MNRRTTIITIALIAIIAVSLTYWYYTVATQKLEGTIEVDGSSTVFPITQAVAEEFIKANPNVRVNVGISGTGGGFKRFTIGEIDICDASRPIKSSEDQQATNNNIAYVAFQIAIDGLAVIVNPSNTWANYMTVQELNKTWQPNSTVTKWSDIRPEWPNQPIRLYGPGTDSGTFDYFTSVIVGQEDASRADYTASEDDNVLVQGIAGDQYALGYFGYAYYAENTDKLKIVPIDSGNGPVTPTDETINSAQYTPLSRPLFIYVNKESLKRPEVKAFVRFYMEHAEQLVAEVGYTPLQASIYQQNIDTLEQQS